MQKEKKELMDEKQEQLLKTLKIDKEMYEKSFGLFQKDKEKNMLMREKENEVTNDNILNLEKKDTKDLTRDQVLGYMKVQFEMQNIFVKDRLNDKRTLSTNEH